MKILEKLDAYLNEKANLKIYHGDNHGTKKLNPRYMNNGNNQEGIGIYFGSRKTAEGYGRNVISIEIDKKNFVDSREPIGDFLTNKKIFKILYELHKTDNEPLYYYITDFGIEVEEPEDVNEDHLKELASYLADDEVRNFQIDLAERFGVVDFVEIWNKYTNIHGTYNDQLGFYSVINTNYKIIKEN